MDRAFDRIALLVAVVFSIVIIADAPFVGQARTAIRSAFPSAFSTIIGALVAVLLGAMILAAITRIRDRRMQRYLLLAAALIAGAGLDRAFRTGNADVDVVETFHFVEYGCLTLLFYLASWPLDDGAVFVLPLLAGILVGTLDEWFQWFIPSRVGEFRDVLLDGVAVACGLLFSIGFHPPRWFTLTLRPPSVRRVGAVVVLTTVVFGLFFQTVHLGYEVDDATADVFRLHYTRAELEGLGVDCSQCWHATPPLVQGRISREDQYLSEGLWHVQRRNRAWSAGDWFVAWRENLILEAFFAPVLDNPSYASRSGLRWPAEQRGEAARRTARTSGSYESDAEPYPIYTWPASIFWAGLVAAVGAILVGATGAGGRPPR